MLVRVHETGLNFTVQGLRYPAVSRPLIHAKRSGHLDVSDGQLRRSHDFRACTSVKVIYVELTSDLPPDTVLP